MYRSKILYGAPLDRMKTKDLKWSKLRFFEAFLIVKFFSSENEVSNHSPEPFPFTFDCRGAVGGKTGNSYLDFS